jgi:hypothetical protein
MTKKQTFYDVINECITDRISKYYYMRTVYYQSDDEACHEIACHLEDLIGELNWVLSVIDELKQTKKDE